MPQLNRTSATSHLRYFFLLDFPAVVPTKNDNIKLKITTGAWANGPGMASVKPTETPVQADLCPLIHTKKTTKPLPSPISPRTFHASKSNLLLPFLLRWSASSLPSSTLQQAVSNCSWMNRPVN